MCVEDGQCQDIFIAVPPSEKQMSKRMHNSFMSDYSVNQ